MKRSMMHAATVGAVALAAALPATGRAATSQPVEAGLWEITITTEAVDSEPARRRYEKLRKHWDKLDPEQRRKVEATVPRPGVPSVLSEQVCITPDEAREGMTYAAVEEDEDCRTDYGESAGGRIPVRMTCREQSATGVGEVVFTGRKRWSSSMRLTARTPGEAPIETVMRTESRWLSRDCGSVKPDRD